MLIRTINAQKERKYSQWTTVSLTQENMCRCGRGDDFEGTRARTEPKYSKHFRPALRMPEARKSVTDKGNG
ncbi:MAG: hypothetical protein J6T88_10390 [Bacteroidales bacterium]|nr:hypothetical protein [Bacteroidales bacterium]